VAEVLGVAASVVGILTFVGQVSQGCQHVCMFLNDAKDAPKYIKCFGGEVKLFYWVLLSFQKALTELESVGKLADMEDEVKLALGHSGEAMTKLKKLVIKCEKMTGFW
jgi:hypothetical protein